MAEAESSACPAAAQDVSGALYMRVVQFLIGEAGLLDSAAYDEWLALWDAANITYWVPCNSDQADPAVSLGIILDDRKHLEERVARLKHRYAHSFHPRSRMQRVVGNVQVQTVHGEIRAQSSFVLGETRRGQQNVWFGKSEHTLIERPGGLLIARKTVLLLNNDDPMPNVVFLP